MVWAWPEIQASLQTGRNLKEIWGALQLDGIIMSYDQFRVYVSRTRKRLARRPALAPAFLERKRTSGFNWSPFPDTGVTRQELPPMPNTAGSDEGKATEKWDPLANVRRSEANRSGFHYRPAVPEDEKDLI